jgi:hypothetical protein
MGRQKGESGVTRRQAQTNCYQAVSAIVGLAADTPVNLSPARILHAPQEVATGRSVGTLPA